MSFSWIIVAIVILLVVWVIALFNGLVQKRNRMKNAWSDIDVQLKRRYDLVPNLVESVKGYKEHEASVLEAVTKARTSAMQATGGADARAQAENMLSGALKTLFAVAENYPQLKASENFQQLQTALADLEEQIQSSRRYYNASVRELNTAMQTFPANMIAGMLGFTPGEFFGADAQERNPVKVSF